MMVVEEEEITLLGEEVTVAVEEVVAVVEAVEVVVVIVEEAVPLPWSLGDGDLECRVEEAVEEGV